MKYLITCVFLLLVQKDGEVVWSQEGVYLINPSIDQCIEVINKLEYKHEMIMLNDSSSDGIQSVIPTILERGTIKTLCISSSLTRDDVLSFSSQLSINKSLKTLVLSNDSISDDGVIALAQSLQYNKTLQCLYLNENPGITSTTAQLLAELLLTNNTLCRLYLAGTNIDTGGVMMLMESLKTNNALRTLSLDEQHKEICSTLPYYEQIKNKLGFW